MLIMVSHLRCPGGNGSNHGHWLQRQELFCSLRSGAGGTQINERSQAGIVPIDLKRPDGTKSIELKVNALGKNNNDQSFCCYPGLRCE